MLKEVKLMTNDAMIGIAMNTANSATNGELNAHPVK